MEKILKYAPGACGAVMGAMMQVGPHDAAANLCDWLRLWAGCRESVPGWFSQYGWAIPSGLLLISAALIAYDLAKNNKYVNRLGEIIRAHKAKAAVIAVVLTSIFFLGIWRFIVAIENDNKGFFAFSAIRLYDTPALSRKYIYDYLSSDGSRVSFYLAADDMFRLSFEDKYKELYIAEARMGKAGVPIDAYIFLYIEVRTGKESTVLRVIVDGKEVARKTYDFPVDAKFSNMRQAVIGADLSGKNLAPFKIQASGFGHTTLNDVDISNLRSSLRVYLDSVKDLQ